MSTRYIWSKNGVSIGVSLGSPGYNDYTVTTLHCEEGNPIGEWYVNYSKNIETKRLSNGDLQWSLSDDRERQEGTITRIGASGRVTKDMSGYYWTSYGISGYGGTVEFTLSDPGNYPAGTYWMTYATGDNVREVILNNIKGDLQGYTSSATDGAYPADGVSGNVCLSKRSPSFPLKVHQDQPVQRVFLSITDRERFRHFDKAAA